MRDLVLTRSVVGHICVRCVLDVANHTVEDIGHLDVTLVVNREHLDRWPVHPLLIGDLLDVLRQLVDGQTWASTDDGSLTRSTGLEHIVRPLPLVVRGPSVKPQVVEFAVTGSRER